MEKKDPNLGILVPRQKVSSMIPGLFWGFSDHAILNTFSVGHLSDWKGKNSKFLLNIPSVMRYVHSNTIKCKINLIKILHFPSHY